MGSKHGCADSTRAMTAARRYEKAVFETVVHFIFLLTGRLTRVYNVADMDMLGNIKFACMSLESSIRARDDCKHALSERLHAREADSESSSEGSVGGSRNAFMPDKHSRSGSPAVMRSNKRARVDSDDGSTDMEPRRKSSSTQVVAVY
jgi:hypothetical protein